MSNAAKIFGRPSVNESQNLFTCADRIFPGDEPRGITSIKSMYIPFDVKNKATYLRKNPFGVVIYRRNVESGKVYQAFLSCTPMKVRTAGVWPYWACFLSKASIMLV